MSTRLPLQDLIKFERADVEQALAEQARVDPAVALVQRQLTGLTPRIGADRLNEALDIDLLELLIDGWMQVPAVRDASARNVRTSGESAIVALGSHEISGRLHPVLALSMSHAPLPDLRFDLTFNARFNAATLALAGGRVEWVAARDATLQLQLTYGELALKQRSISPWPLPAELTVAPRDPPAAAAG